MPTASQRDESWSRFWDRLVARLEAHDLTSRSRSKFNDLAEWLAGKWDLTPAEVVCKYVQHPKNRWNRLREAARREPTAIFLLFEGDDHGDLMPRVKEAATACPTLKLVVALVRPPGGEWEISALLHRASTQLPPLLVAESVPVAPIAFTALAGSRNRKLMPPIPDVGPERLAESLHALGAVGGSPTGPHRSAASQTLVEFTGQDAARIAFKTIPDSKNLGNRLGEALARYGGPHSSDQESPVLR